MDNSQSLSDASKPRTSARVIVIIAVLLLCAFAVVFLIGYLPRRERTQEIVQAAQKQSDARPVVLVAKAHLAPRVTELILPGNIQPITEAPILARAGGYLIKRYVDIGDRVTAGQLLAKIDTPELDQQVRQAQAALQQSRATLAQAQANLSQAQANAGLAKVTAERNSTLVSRGVLSKQEGDQSSAGYNAQLASVEAGTANVSAAQQNVGAAEAELRRLTEMQGFKNVRAPFAGIITLRNIDTGALINSASTLLFRMAQTGMLRIFINVPQSNYTDLRVGAPAQIVVQELPGRKFVGKVSRVSGSLDTSTRTMLSEIAIPNPDNRLVPGMYAQVQLSIARARPPVMISGEAVVIHAATTSVAIVDSDDTVHFHGVQLGRDYGREVEIVSGLNAGEQVIINPSDAVREGVKVKASPYNEGQRRSGGGPRG
jgi:RND family efflux transporter MFP subunit